MPLKKTEQDTIIKEFAENDSDFDPIPFTQINSRRGCKFGFIQSRKLTPTLLYQIIEAAYTDSKVTTIQFLEILKDANTPDTQGLTIIQNLLNEFNLPIKTVLPPKLMNKPVGQQKHFLTMIDGENNWYEEEQQAQLISIALQRIKYLKAKVFDVWQQEFNAIIEEYPAIFGTEEQPIFQNFYTKTTVAALVKTYTILQNDDEVLEERNEATTLEICQVLSEETIERDSSELKQFGKTYLTGNFPFDLDTILSNTYTIPAKSNMCLFTGKVASEVYGSAKAHGVRALGFSGRNVSTLKSKSNRISSLFYAELEQRKNLIEDKHGFNTCIYYDFGEYLTHFDTHQLLYTLATVKGFDLDKDNLLVNIDNNSFNYNLYGINFKAISEDVKGNFYYIQQSLKLIQKTGFRMYSTSVISPYHTHREMFVFENAMPFVKQLGWDKIRIDEIEERLKELNVFLRLGKKKLNLNIINYTEDRRSIFTAFQALEPKEQKNTRTAFTYLINHILSRFYKNYKMSTMKNLAAIALKMAKPKSSASSQETRMIRDALQIIRVCVKEGVKDKETITAQIVGELRQMGKNNKTFKERYAFSFAEAVYEDLFIQTWKEQFPKPSRLRNWINEFAVWYSNLNYKEARKRNVQRAIDTLNQQQELVSEDSIIEWLKQDKANENKAVDNYEDDFRKAFQDINQAAAT